MTTQKQIIQLELNEVSLSLVEGLVGSGLLPNFERLTKEWHVYQTTSEQKYEYLEPWIQWVTVHTGKSFSEHGIFHLGDSKRLTSPQIWEVLSQQGIESVVISPMNAHRGEKTVGGVFIPDPWSKENDTFPESFAPLWEFISSRVQSHAVKRTLQKFNYVSLIYIILKYGIPISLLARILTQLIKQKLDPKNSWRLAVLFDEFLFKIFLKLALTRNAGFNSLFLNSIAHYQHHFWRKHQPNLFNPSLTVPDCRPAQDPIMVGLLAYDKMIGDLLKHLKPDANRIIMIVTGLSQVPFTDREANGGTNYYRLNDHQLFLNMLGLGSCKAYPMMSRDWQVKINPDSSIDDVEALLAEVHVHKNALFNVSRNSADSLFVETSLEALTPEDAPIVSEGRELGPFGKWFTRTAIKSGHHSGLGTVWSSKPIFAPSGSNITLWSLFPGQLNFFQKRV